MKRGKSDVTLKVSLRGEGEFLDRLERARLDGEAVLCDDGEEGGDGPYEFENEVETFRSTVGSSPSDVTLSRNVEPRRAGADEGGFDAAESTESASDKESDGLWERWDKEADRGEMGGKSARGVEREVLEVEKKEEMKLMFLTLSKGAVFGRLRSFLAARSQSRCQ